MADETFIWRGIRRDEGADELDAPARRIGLVLEHPIGRAIVEAETARDAGGQVLGAHTRR